MALSVDSNRPSDLRWVVAPAAIAVASRVYSIILLAQYTAGALELPRLTQFTSPFVAWDAQWYIHIAEFGYHAAPQQASRVTGGHHDFAFYPGWPMLISIATLGGRLPVEVIAPALANLLFVLAAVVVYRVFADRFGDRTALWGVVLLAFNPVGYVFSMAYSEAAFMLAASLYFVNRYGRLSPLLAALSMLCRISGLAVAASAAVMFLTRPDLRRRTFLICVAVAATFAAWWAFIWHLTGNIEGWFEGSPSWGKYEGIDSIVREIKIQAPLEILWFGFVLLMIGGSLLLLRSHTDMAVFGLVAIALSLVGAPAPSMPRHSMIAFPAYAALAQRLGPRGSAVAAIAFALAEILFVDFAFGANYHPP